MDSEGFTLLREQSPAPSGFSLTLLTGGGKSLLSRFLRCFQKMTDNEDSQ